MRMDAARVRAETLLRVRELADRDADRMFPWLIERCGEDPRLLQIRLWRVDQAVFGSSRMAALGAVSRMMEWTRSGNGRPAGVITLAWVLDAKTNGSRLAAWIMAMLLREFKRRENRGVDMLFMPNPYDWEE